MSIKKCLILKILGACLLLCSASAYCMADSTKANKVKVAYIYKIPKFIKWPSHVSRMNTINICVLGKDPFNGTLSYLKDRKVNNKIISITQITKNDNIEALSKCQIAYLSSITLNEKLRTVINENNILTISDSENFLELGGMIALENKLGKISLGINLKSTSQAKIKVRSNLLEIANKVITKKP